MLKRSGQREPFERRKVVAGSAPPARTGRSSSRPSRRSPPTSRSSCVRADRRSRAKVSARAVLERLRLLDDVASVRFASVYKGFEDVWRFHARARSAPRGPRRSRRRALLRWLTSFRPQPNGSGRLRAPGRPRHLLWRHRLAKWAREGSEIRRRRVRGRRQGFGTTRRRSRGVVARRADELRGKRPTCRSSPGSTCSGGPTANSRTTSPFDGVSRPDARSQSGRHVCPDPSAVFFGLSPLQPPGSPDVGWATLDAAAPAVRFAAVFPGTGPATRFPSPCCPDRSKRTSGSTSRRRSTSSSEPLLATRACSWMPNDWFASAFATGPSTLVFRRA